MRSELRILAVDRTEVNDAGLAHLRGLSQLRELSLVGAQVSQRAIQDLLDACPRCTVYGP